MVLGGGVEDFVTIVQKARVTMGGGVGGQIFLQINMTSFMDKPNPKDLICFLKQQSTLELQ